MSSECALAVSDTYFSDEEVATLRRNEIPRHVGIIMDGNRRWTKKKSAAQVLSPLGGHWAGAQALTPIVEAACELGIKVLTVYGFSTENWARSSREIEMIFSILKTFLQQNRKKMKSQGVCFDVIGDLAPFNDELKEQIQITKDETRDGKALRLVVALNYGGRDEICRMMKKVFCDIERGILTSNDIEEAVVSQYLDTAPFGDPDLLIRTSGEMRISNFLLWQLAYTEVYVTDVLWPDFTPRELFKAVIEFQKRQRRQGR